MTVDCAKESGVRNEPSGSWERLFDYMLKGDDETVLTVNAINND